MEEPGCELSQSQQEERPFKCGQCQRSYRHAGSLVNHRRTHEVGLFTCLLCCKEFSNPMALKNHLRIHSEERRHRCPDCDRSFRIASQLASHRCSAHTILGLKEEENNFQQGQDSLSSDADVFPALEGGGAGTLLSNLEKYIAESVVPADFSQLESPGKAEEGQEAPGMPAEERRYKCNQCDKAYKHAGSLTNHKQSHTLGVYQCAVCYKEFSNLMALKNHTRLHSEYRPYKCPLCCKAFRLPSELLGHQKTHEKARWAGRAPSEGSDHSVSEEDSIETSAKLDIYQPPPAAFGEGAPCSLKDGAKAGGGDQGNPDGELCVRCGGNFADEGDLRNHSCLYPEEEEEDEKTNGGSSAQPTLESEGAWETSSKDGEQARPYQCGECGRTYRHAGSLINHKKSHQTGVYSCNVCCKQLFNLAALKNHLRIHLKSKPASQPGLRYSCPPVLEEATCHLDQSPTEPARGERAMELPGGGETEGRGTLKEETGCVEEEEDGASEERPYRCGECGRTYRHRGSLVNHRHTHQTGVYQCSLCPKQYSNLMALRNHVRMHFRAARGKERGSYTCASCGESFEEEAEFQRHQLRHVPGHAAPHPQEGIEVKEELGSVHTQEVVLPQAIKREVEDLEAAGPAPGMSHICRCCGMIFYDLGSLQSHALTHSGGEPGTGEGEPEPPGRRTYSCELCGKSYRHSGSLINHKQTHQMGDFECSLCAKRFSNVATLKSHLRGHQKPRKGRAGVEKEEEGGVVEAELGDAPNGMLKPEGGGEAGCDGLESPRVEKEEMPGQAELSQICDLQGGSLVNGWQHLKEEEAGASPPSSPRPQPYQCEILDHKNSQQLGIYQCSLCPKEYSNLAALKSHFRGHTTAQQPGTSAEERPFLCSLCGMIFPSETDLQRHHRLAHSGEGELWEGSPEGGEGAAFPALKQEVEERSDERGGEEEMLLSHICGYCGQTFDDMASLEEHSLGHQEEKEAALADTTIQLWLGPRLELLEEQKSSLTPPDSRPYACGQCGKTYRHGGSLVNHKKTHQVGDYQCGVCSRQYPNLSAYRNHLRNHPKCKLNGSRPASNRDSTGKELVLPYGRDGGEASVTPAPEKQGPEGSDAEECKPHVCDICGEVCKGVAGLKAHCAAQHPEEEMVSVAEEEEEGGGSGEEGATLERPFCCEQCGRSYKHAGSLINHKQTHKTGLFRCSICQKLFYNLMALKNHNRIHFETKRYKCGQCPKAFRLQKQLASHQRVHRERKLPPSSSSSRKLALTKRAGKAYTDGGCVVEPPAAPKHPNPEERPYRCEQCGRTYRHAGSLLNHRKSHKTGHYCCPVCPRAYPNLMALKNHQRIHFEVKRHRCPDCSKAFKWQRQLVRHQLVHAQRRPRPGSRSSSGRPLPEGSTPGRRWRLARREQSNSHIDASGGHVDGGHVGTTSDGHVGGTSDSHVGSASVGASGSHVGGASGYVNVGTQIPVGVAPVPTGPFQCPACPKQFPNPSALKNHGRVHTKKRFECSECGKAYRASRDLVQHLWRHQAEAEARAAPGTNGLVDRRPYKCDRCERTYRHAGSLLHHKKVHTIGLYRCPACLKEFHNLLALTYHLRTHSDKKGHRCPDCDQAFRTSSRLASHAKACHGHAVTGEGQGPETGSCPDEGVGGTATAAMVQAS